MPNGSPSGVGSILIFTVEKDIFEKEILEKFKGLELTDYSEWKKVVTYYRSKEKPSHIQAPVYPECLSRVCAREQDISYIKGPMFHRNHSREDFVKYDLQFCIKRNEMADRFNFLKKVLFCVTAEVWHLNFFSKHWIFEFSIMNVFRQLLFL